ncbi:hypothetical protein VTO42DRAFT_2185 [Malbranchea cinnamomea]
MRILLSFRSSVLSQGRKLTGLNPPLHRQRLPPSFCPSPAFIRAASAAASRKLDLLAIDKKWKEKWQNEPSSQLCKHHGNEKAYILSMFPYPSGTLHMGHVRVYTISDVLARYKHMKGYDVLHPMGWDAFGLPAENAAIERGIDPAHWTKQNIVNMKEQLKGLGTYFDWDRELMTCAPEFYKHTQRLFLMLYEKGLAYQAKAIVNYDPVDKTVLANEQVDANGCSWRSGAKVEKRELKQWFLRITAFKEALLKDLDTLSGGWPERILSMQRNWLGKSSGARIKFKISTPDDAFDIGVFTTRPDTLHGVQYLALSATHPLVLRLAKSDANLQSFLDSAESLPSDSKAGYRLPNVRAFNPLRALEHIESLPESVPVYVAPYVLADYGEGAVMGVPGHDSRDFAFWTQNAPSEPVHLVVQANVASESEAEDKKPYLGQGVLTDLCGSYSRLPSVEAAQKIVNDLQSKDNLAEPTESWRLRDWLISRQRYWGAPIPIIHCDHCGPVPVPEDQLPVELPVVDGSRFKEKAGNPLESAKDWLHTACPKCGEDAKRDTDTMDTFVDSSWYFLRFLDPFNDKAPFSPALARPVDTYIGGIEHAILHLLYSRFIYKFLAQEGLVPSGPAPEPFLRLISQGMVHGKTYSDPQTGRFLRPSEVDLTNPNSPVIVGTQVTPNVSFEKMSKSKYNGVDPTACITKYGADATRAHVLFAAPVSEILEWDESKIVGIQRWFSRLWKVVTDTRRSLTDSFAVTTEQLKSLNSITLPALDQLSDEEVELLIHTQTAISSVSHCLENNPYALNTVISTLTKFTNALASSTLPSTSSPSPNLQTILYLTVTSHLRLLAPIAPAFTSECWEELHSTLLKQSSSEPPTVPSIFSSPWPTSILTPSQLETLSARRSKTVTVQINGKVRFTTSIPRAPAAPPEATDAQARTLEEDWILSHILATEEGKIWLREKNDWEKRKRVVVVGGGKIVSVVF